MSSAEMPSKHDVLAGHLYEKIDELEPMVKACYSTAKITGMLLDGSDENVIRMLQEPSYLLKSVDKAVKILENQSDNRTCYDSCEQSDHGDGPTSAAVISPELCDRLYEQVFNIEPELCSQITGMLAELDAKTVSELVNSTEMLKGAVIRAKNSYLRNLGSTTDDHLKECNNNAQNDTDSVDVGDLLYSKVCQVFPQHAAEITGMLLEMEASQLKGLMLQPKQLQICIQKAYDALQQYKDNT